MTVPRSLTSPNARDAAHDRRTALVKEMAAKESATLDANTARLRALRLAKETEAQRVTTPIPAKPRRNR